MTMLGLHCCVRAFSSCCKWGLFVAECGLSSCGTQAQFPHSMWNPPGLRIEPMSPANRQTPNHLTTMEVLHTLDLWIFEKPSVQSVQLPSRVQLFATPWTAACQASLSITNSWSPPKPMCIESVMPSNHLILCHPLLFLPSIFPSTFSKWVSSSHQVAKVLQFQLQQQSVQWIFKTDFLQDWLIWSPCSPRDSQESSPTPQFKSINTWAFSFLYSPTLTSIHDYWKNHSFD